MRWLVDLAATYHDELIATFRETFGVSLFDVGTARLTWGEAAALARHAIGDLRTVLGAKLNGINYPVSFPELTQIMVSRSLLGKSVDPLMPFSKLEAPDATAAEIAAAEAQLEESIIFS